MNPRDIAGKFDELDVDELFRVSTRESLNNLGSHANRKTRKITGETVYIGGESHIDEPQDDGLIEAAGDEYRDLIEDGAEIGVVYDKGDLGLDDHQELHNRGVMSDVYIEYGEQLDDFVQRLEEVIELNKDSGLVRSVHLAPQNDTSTANQDLWAVVMARLALDGVDLIRLDPRNVGYKLFQTSLLYGVNDAGFLEWFDEQSAEVVINEAGLEIKRRETWR